MRQGNRRIPDALLERYLADALPASEHERLTRALADSAQDRAKLEELRADSAAFLVKHPPGPLVAKVAASRGSTLRGRWLAFAAPVLAGALAVALLVVRPPTTEPEFTTKGSVALAVYVRQGSGSVKVTPGAPLPANAAVRFEVRAPKAGFVAVLSLDGRGQVTVYHPYGGQDAAPYDPSQPLLSTAIEVDGAGVSETLHALYSEQRFTLGWAVKALQQGKALRGAAPDGVAVASFELGSTQGR